MRWRKRKLSKKSSDDKWFHAFGYMCAIDDYYFFSHSHLCIETYNDVEKIESPCRVFTASSASFIPQKPRADGNLYYIKEKNRGKSFVTSTAVGGPFLSDSLSQGLSTQHPAEATSASTIFYYKIFHHAGRLDECAIVSGGGRLCSSSISLETMSALCINSQQLEERVLHSFARAA
jgi:hypothetical protein